MAKKMNVVTLFEDFDNSKEECHSLYMKALEMSEEVRKRKAQIYNQIFNELPISRNNAKTAKEILDTLTDDPQTRKRLQGMLTSARQRKYCFDGDEGKIFISRVGYIGKILKAEDWRISYSIACDENGEPIPGAAPIQHKRKVKVYWFQK